MSWVETILLILLIQHSLQTIKYDSGLNTQYQEIYGGSPFICENSGSPIHKTTVFSGTFQNIPKIIVTPVQYQYSNQKPTDIYFDIISVALTEFTTSVQCKNNRVFKFQFRWAAIDDYRIEVINAFGTSVSATSQTFTHSHTNMNALQGYITVVSLGYNGLIDFSLVIATITYNQVTATFTSSNSNLYLLGYQIVLGTTEAFTQSAVITSEAKSAYQNIFVSEVLTIPTGQCLVLPLMELKMQTTSLVELFYEETSTSSTIQYRYHVGPNSYLFRLSHSQVWFNRDNSVEVPFLLQKMRVSKLFDKQITSKPSIQVQVLEKSETITVPTTKNYIFTPIEQTLNIIVGFQCAAGKKVSGFLLKCPTCSVQGLPFNQNCYGSINNIIFYITLNQLDQLYQSADLVVTTSGFTFTQTVGASQSYTVVQLTIS